MATYTIKLPDELAHEAGALGLLNDALIAALLAEAVRKHRVSDLFEAADRLAAVELPRLNPAEVQEEIHSARTSGRAGRP